MSAPPLADEAYSRLLALRTGLRQFERWSEEQARAVGLTAMQHQLLLAVRGHPDPRGPTIGEVAEYLLLRHHSAVGLVDRADAAGLVVRVRDPQDRRVARLRLTGTGAARLELLSGLHVEEIERLATRLSGPGRVPWSSGARVTRDPEGQGKALRLTAGGHPAKVRAPATAGAARDRPGDAARGEEGLAAMGALDGRVAIITGAGRGIGREHALLFAAEGARVVVNDAGGALDGSPGEPGAAELVVREIREAGGEAVANSEDVADWAAGRRLVQAAVEAFGGLDVLVNNAGILRDRFLVNMSEEEWDDVVRVHLKGHFVPTHWAASYWRERAKSGDTPRAAIVNTTSTSGLLGNPGQANYGAAKAGIGALTVIAAQELGRYGVRVNAIAPAARTRMTATTPGLSELVKPPAEQGAFDTWAAGNVSPLVACLARRDCALTGKVFFAQGGRVQLFQPWTLGASVDAARRWTIEELDEALAGLTS